MVASKQWRQSYWAILSDCNRLCIFKGVLTGLNIWYSLIYFVMYKLKLTCSFVKDLYMRLLYIEKLNLFSWKKQSLVNQETRDIIHNW